MSMLIIHPFLGEMGWQLMRWQAHCRHVSRRHAGTIAFCMPGYEFLYWDFSDEVCPITVTGGRTDMWDREGYTIKKDIFYDKYQAMKQLKTDTQLIPDRAEMTRHIKQEWLKWGRKVKECEFDVVIHARADTKKVYGGDRNWPMENWQALVQELHGGLSFACIGSREGAYHVPETIDLRGQPIPELCNILRSSHLCVGPSSGPMHLASLCGCSHLVWTDRKRWHLGESKGTNRDRYERVWNPFHTRAEVVDMFGWCPTPEEIYPFVKDLIK